MAWPPGPACRPRGFGGAAAGRAARSPRRRHRRLKPEGARFLHTKPCDAVPRPPPAGDAGASVVIHVAARRDQERMASPGPSGPEPSGPRAAGRPSPRPGGGQTSGASSAALHTSHCRADPVSVNDRAADRERPQADRGHCGGACGPDALWGPGGAVPMPCGGPGRRGGGPCPATSQQRLASASFSNASMNMEKLVFL